MQQSTYFKLNLIEGSDIVNPLTIDKPNYEKIDTQMHANQIGGIVAATETKSGTVHAITCLIEGAKFFTFNATSDFVQGDTFTFNTSPVTAVLPNGAGLPTGIFKINSAVLCSIDGSKLTVYAAGEKTYTVGETIITADARFDPNVSIGGTWTKETLSNKNIEPTQIVFGDGVSSTAPEVCNFSVRSGICFVTFYAVSCAGPAELAVNVPTARHTIYSTSPGGALILTSQGKINCGEKINNESFYISYPVAETTNFYIWTKTE